MDLHQVHSHPIGLTGPYVTGGPVGPDILGTGFVPASKAPLLDTTPAGDVEGLIGVGPLIASEKVLYKRREIPLPYEDLSQILHRSSKGL